MLFASDSCWRLGSGRDRDAAKAHSPPHNLIVQLRVSHKGLPWATTVLAGGFLEARVVGGGYRSLAYRMRQKSYLPRLERWAAGMVYSNILRLHLSLWLISPLVTTLR